MNYNDLVIARIKLTISINLTIRAHRESTVPNDNDIHKDDKIDLLLYAKQQFMEFKISWDLNNAIYMHVFKKAGGCLDNELVLDSFLLYVSQLGRNM